MSLDDTLWSPFRRAYEAFREFFYLKAISKSVHKLLSGRRHLLVRDMARTWTPEGLGYSEKVSAGLLHLFRENVLVAADRKVEIDQLASELLYLEAVIYTIEMILETGDEKDYTRQALVYLGINRKPLFVQYFLQLLLAQQELDKQGADGSGGGAQDGGSGD